MKFFRKMIEQQVAEVIEDDLFITVLEFKNYVADIEIAKSKLEDELEYIKDIRVNMKTILANIERV